MFFSLILHRVEEFHFCDHDFIQSQITPQSAEQLNVRRRPKSTGSEKIRITLDFSLLGNELDTQECHYAGQPVTWAAGTFTCTEEDVLSQEKINVLKETMQNVENYLESIFYVDPLNYDFILYCPKNYFDYGYTKYATNTDLHLTVVSRPYGASSTLASAGYILTDISTKRPVQGGVYVNPKSVPNHTQSETSTNSKFFYVCIHEIFHAMGVSSSCFPDYHPRNSSAPHENIYCSLYDEATGKNHTFLVTPHAHEFAVQHWGSERFTSGSEWCPAGIEIEDGGGSGTAGSHPECRIGHSDLMVGVTIQGEVGPFQRFSPLTMAILLDTGFYDIDYRKIQPLLWGNKETIDGNHINNFVMGPPDNVFPQQYIYRPNSDPYFDYCGFDFKTLGGLNKFDINTDENYNCKGTAYQNSPQTRAYCAAEKFYNPNGNAEISRSWAYDFQIIHFPSKEVCQPGYACIGGMRMCGQYIIANDEKSFTIQIDSQLSHTCNSANAGKNYTIYGTTVRCPPYEQFIRTVRMYENQPYLTSYPFTSSTSPVTSPPTTKTSETSETTKTSEPQTSNSSKPQTPNSSKPKEDPESNNLSDSENSLGAGFITVIVIVVAVIVVIIIISVIFCRKKRSSCGNEEYSSDEKLYV